MEGHHALKEPERQAVLICPKTRRFIDTEGQGEPFVRRVTALALAHSPGHSGELFSPEAQSLPVPQPLLPRHWDKLFLNQVLG